MRTGEGHHKQKIVLELLKANFGVFAMNRMRFPFGGDNLVPVVIGRTMTGIAPGPLHVG